MENNEVNVNRDWEFGVNLSGLVAPTGKGGNMLPTGYYTVRLTDLYINPDRNPSRVVIKVQVAEGPFAGVIRTSGIGIPTSAEDKVRYYWRGLAESAGYTPTQLDGGEVNLSMGTFKDKTAYIMFTSKDDAEKGFEEVDFLPPLEWKQQKENFEMGGGAEQAAQRAQQAQAAAQKGSALGGGGGGGSTALGGSTVQKGSSSLGGGGSTPSLGGGGGTPTGTKKSELMNRLGLN